MVLIASNEVAPEHTEDKEDVEAAGWQRINKRGLFGTPLRHPQTYQHTKQSSYDDELYRVEQHRIQTDDIRSA